MYARLNYVGIKPELMDELTAFWVKRVGAYDGLEKAYLMRDGDTGWTLTVALFDSARAMEENTQAALKSVAKDATRYRTSEPEVHQREVLAHMPGRPGKIGYARVADVEIAPKDVDEASATWPSQIDAYEAEPGFRHAYFCGDRRTGKIASISFWGSKADADANEASGAFQAAMAPHRALMTKAPTITHWNVMAVVG